MKITKLRNDHTAITTNERAARIILIFIFFELLFLRMTVIASATTKSRAATHGGRMGQQHKHKQWIHSSRICSFALLLMAFGFGPHYVLSADVTIGADGKPCVDTHDKCPFWADTGECNNNKGYMEENCRLSCNRCHISREEEDAASAEMNAYIESRKADIDAIMAKREKAKSEFFLSADVKIGADGKPCVDTHDKCPFWAATAGECDKEKGYIMGENCRLSCDRCHIIDPSEMDTFVLSAEVVLDADGKPCVDAHDECPFWAATGECDNNKGYMEKNCRRSCDRCHITGVGDESELNTLIESRMADIDAIMAKRKKAEESVLEGNAEL